MLKIRKTQLTLLAVALVALLSAGAAQADITTSNGSNAHGTATGTITSVTYDSSGNLSSVEFTDTNGSVNTITNGEIDNDITDFGSQLERAFDNGDQVTITAEYGDMTGLTRKKKVKEVEQVPQQMPR
jgi:YD repeat-containing protein